MKKQKSGLYEKSLIRIILFLCINFIHFPLYGYYFKNYCCPLKLFEPKN